MDSLLEPIADSEEHPFCTEMMKRLDIQRRNEHFCDVILEVGSGDDQARLKTHRNVLCAASPFFYNALNSDMKEKKEGVIRLEGTSKAVMEEVLDYLYTGHVEVTELGNAYELFAQANYFLIPTLKALSGKFILQTLDVSNCIVAYYFAIKYQWEELLKRARDFILANFVAVAGSEVFLNLSSKEIKEWISSDEIIVKEEEDVFEVIVKWMDKNWNKEDLDFMQLLCHVRSIYVSRSYLVKILQHPLVKASTACTDFLLDSMKEVANGTDECFFSQSPRNCLKTHKDAIVACGKKRTLCYIPSENKWYELADLSLRRNPYLYAISSIHSKLFIIGGNIDPNDSIAEYYDPSRNQWAPAKAPETVNHRSVAVTLQDFLYIVGGKDKDGNRISTVQKYNPDTNRWQEVSPLSGPRSSVCAVADGNYLYAIGGICDPSLSYLDIVERFDPRNNIWDKLPSTLAKRAGACGTAIKQKVFVFGGLNRQSTAGDPCEMYDPATNMWSSIPSVVAPRHVASMVSFKGQIYAVGEFQNEQSGEEGALQVYDIDKNKWKRCTDYLLGGDEAFKISTLRILRDVLAKCKVLS